MFSLIIPSSRQQPQCSFKKLKVSNLAVECHGFSSFAHVLDEEIAENGADHQGAAGVEEVVVLEGHVDVRVAEVRVLVAVPEGDGEPRAHERSDTGCGEHAAVDDVEFLGAEAVGLLGRQQRLRRAQEARGHHRRADEQRHLHGVRVRDLRVHDLRQRELRGHGAQREDVEGVLPANELTHDSVAHAAEQVREGQEDDLVLDEGVGDLVRVHGFEDVVHVAGAASQVREAEAGGRHEDHLHQLEVAGFEGLGGGQGGVDAAAGAAGEVEPLLVVVVGPAEAERTHQHHGGLDAAEADQRLGQPGRARAHLVEPLREALHRVRQRQDFVRGRLDHLAALLREDLVALLHQVFDCRAPRLLWRFAECVDQALDEVARQHRCAAEAHRHDS